MEATNQELGAASERIREQLDAETRMVPLAELEPLVGPNGETIEQYPYDPSTRGRTDGLRGLDKVRAVADPKQRVLMWNLTIRFEANESDPRFQAEERRREALEAAERRKRALGIVVRAIDGDFGAAAQRLADHRLVELEIEDVKDLRGTELDGLANRIRRMRGR